MSLVKNDTHRCRLVQERPQRERLARLDLHGLDTREDTVRDHAQVGEDEVARGAEAHRERGGRGEADAGDEGHGGQLSAFSGRLFEVEQVSTKS